MMNRNQNRIRQFCGLLCVWLLCAAGCSPAAVPSESESPERTVSVPETVLQTTAEDTAAPMTAGPSTAAPSEAPSQTAEVILPLSGLTVCLDPGHQSKGNSEKEPCAPWGPEKNEHYNNTVLKNKCASGTEGVQTGIAEYIVTLQISLKLRDALAALGAEVVLTRATHNVNLSNIERAEIANKCNADITLRIHCNGSENQSASGILIISRGAGDGSEAYSALAARDYAYASALSKALLGATAARNDGLWQSDAYTGINWAQNTCLIVECGYMSNPAEDMLLTSPEYQEKLISGFVAFFCGLKEIP